MICYLRIMILSCILVTGTSTFVCVNTQSDSHVSRISDVMNSLNMKRGCHTLLAVKHVLAASGIYSDPVASFPARTSSTSVLRRIHCRDKITFTYSFTFITFVCVNTQSDSHVSRISDIMNSLNMKRGCHTLLAVKHVLAASGIYSDPVASFPARISSTSVLRRIHCRDKITFTYSRKAHTVLPSKHTCCC